MMRDLPYCKHTQVQRSQVPSLTHPAPSQPIPSSQVMPTQAGTMALVHFYLLASKHEHSLVAGLQQVSD